MGFLEAIVATLAAGSALLGTTLAHPGGEEHSAEHVRKSLDARELAIAHATQVSKCAASPKHAALQQRAVARRALTAQLLREKRNIIDSENPPSSSTSSTPDDPDHADISLPWR